MSRSTDLRRGDSDGECLAMKCEKNRLKSFSAGWPHQGTLSGVNMAAAGLFFTGTNDKVKCPFCKVIIECWEANDDPLAQHRQYSFACSFLQDPLACGNMPIDGQASQQWVSAAAAHNSHKCLTAGADSCYDAYIPKQSSVPPTDSQMEDPTNRLSTFGKWPKDNKKLPAELYPAGFCYTGVGDKVRCFVCHIFVEGWNRIEDVWFEHARLSPDCEYVKTNKGEFYVDQVLNRPNVVILKDTLRTFAKEQKFSDYVINPVLAAMYKDEEEMRQAVLNLTEHDYQKLTEQPE